MKPLACPETGCRSKFDTSVALTFHLKEEHPGGTDAHRDLLRQARAREYREKQNAATIRARKVVDALIAMGCPCEKSKAWHDEQRAKMEAAA